MKKFFHKAVVLALVGTALISLHFSTAGGATAEPRAEGKLSPRLWREVYRSERPDTARIPVIVRLKEDFHARLAARRRGPRPANALDLIQGYQAWLSPRQVDLLLTSEQVEYVASDAVITASGNPRNLTVGLQQQYGATRSKNDIGLNGKSVRVAVFDSGVADHPDLGGRFEALVDFTNGRSAFYKDKTDAYGHGTHVAGIIAGGGRQSSGAYAGLATEADLVVLRVIGEDGTGWTSDLIRAIEWVIANRAKYDIRVANLSLGHPAFEPYWLDPLCLAVERMVDAGVVTVVSAGNLGKTADYPEIWGAITSPGTAPSVITVGAVNTLDTATHDDDIATTYSSRGPTIDGLLKPDLVAPGNRIVAPYAPYSRVAVEHPGLVRDQYYMEMSGSSMAAAAVSAAAVLLVDAQPALTPRMVKALLMLTAVRMPRAHILEQGNGMLNVLTAVQLAKSVDFKKRRFGAVPPYWSLWGETVWSGGAMAFGDQAVFSSIVGSDPQQLWGEGLLWSEGMFWSEGLPWTDDVFNPDGMLWVDSSVQTDGAFWVEGVFWADGTFWVEHIPWEDLFVGTEGILWAETADTIEGDAGWILGGDR